MVQALAGTAGVVTTALANQKKRDLPIRKEKESIVPLLAVVDKPKKRKQLIDQAREERIWDLLTQPEVIGLVMTMAGIYASQKIRFVANDAANEGLQGVATSTSILLGLGHAGVGDLTTAIIAGLAGVASVIEGVVPDIGNIDITDPSGDTWNALSWLNPVTWGLGRAFGGLPKPSYME